MNVTIYILLYWLFFGLIFGLIIYFSRKGMLSDDLRNSPSGIGSEGSVIRIRTFSLSSVQLAWWTLIILPAFAIAVIHSKEIPPMNAGLLALLGISGGTTALSKAIDGSGDTNPPAQASAMSPHGNFFTDLISTGDGTGIHRIQTVIFHLIIGIWFVVKTLENIAGAKQPVLPEIKPESLTLLGISAVIYTALKSSEKKPA